METTSRIPAGLTDLNVEIFVSEGKIQFTKGGTVHPFEKMDVHHLALIRTEMDNYPAIIDALEAMNIVDPVEQIRQFILCNFGDFDSRADITSDGIILREYWDCGKRGCCAHEGKLCTLPSGPNGQLTPREIEIIKLVACDLADKEIADRLDISTFTVCKHRSNIEYKIAAHSKVGIALFAKDHNII